MKPKDLRDEFALKAIGVAGWDVLKKLDENFTLTDTTDNPIPASVAIARVAYEIADAMMAERENINEA